MPHSLAETIISRAAGRIDNLSIEDTIACESIPHLVTLVQDGGLVPHLEKKLAAARRKPTVR